MSNLPHVVEGAGGISIDSRPDQRHEMEEGSSPPSSVIRPLTGRRLALDVPVQRGASLPWEDALRTIARYTAAMVEALGVQVVLTEGSSDPESLDERSRAIEEHGTEVLICLRAGRHASTHIRGLRALTPGRYLWRNRKLAEWLLNRVGERTGLPSRGIPLWPWFPLEVDALMLRTRPTCVVFECGCLTCPADEVLMSRRAFQVRCAQGLTEGLLRFLGLSETDAFAVHPVLGDDPEAPTLRGERPEPSEEALIAEAPSPQAAADPPGEEPKEALPAVLVAQTPAETEPLGSHEVAETAPQPEPVPAEALPPAAEPAPEPKAELAPEPIPQPEATPAPEPAKVEKAKAAASPEAYLLAANTPSGPGGSRPAEQRHPKQAAKVNRPPAGKTRAEAKLPASATTRHGMVHRSGGSGFLTPPLQWPPKAQNRLPQGPNGERPAPMFQTPDGSWISPRAYALLRAQQEAQKEVAKEQGPQVGPDGRIQWPSALPPGFSATRRPPQ